jgi:hypothetical protein
MYTAATELWWAFSIIFVAFCCSKKHTFFGHHLGKNATLQEHLCETLLTSCPTVHCSVIYLYTYIR